MKKTTLGLFLLLSVTATAQTVSVAFAPGCSPGFTQCSVWGGRGFPPPQLVQTTSSAASVIVANGGVTPVVISGIRTSGDFLQANNCIPQGAAIGALQPGSSCIVRVRFTPTATGTRTGSLMVTDNALGSPHILALSGTGSDLIPGNFVFTSSMRAGYTTDVSGTVSLTRSLHTATLLNNGKVLVAGGKRRFTSAFVYAPALLPSAELYDSTANRFISTGEMRVPRSQHDAALLNDGRVLITGGYDSGFDDNLLPGYPALASAEIYDPATGTFSAVRSMNSRRVGHTSTLLRNGEVLITGGSDGTNALATAEIYDPVKGKFKSVPGMLAARSTHTATLLADGSVLIAGGYGAAGSLSTAELYDPEDGVFRLTGSMAQPRSRHTATLLNGGKVLVAGLPFLPHDAPPSATFPGAELYDPIFGTFSATGPMVVTRLGHRATLLNDGRVLVTGGQGSTLATEGLTQTEIYEPSTNTFARSADVPTSWLNDNTSTLLNSGQILLTGGYAEGWAYDQAELYQPTSFIPPGLVSIAIRPRPLLVEAGDARQLFAIGTFEGWRKQILYSVNWSSSTPQVAEVSDAGVVYGKKPGIVTITARTGSTHGSVTFIVVKQKWGDLR